MMIIPLLSILISTSGAATPMTCQGSGIQNLDLSGSNVEVLCENSKVRELKKFFSRNNSLMSFERFNNEGQLIEKMNYNLEGDLTGWRGQSWLSESEYLEERYYLNPSRKVLTSKSQYKVSNDGNKQLVKRWNYKKSSDLPQIAYALESIDQYNERGQIITRKLITSPYGLENYTFNYNQPIKKNRYGFVDSFTITDDLGTLVGDFKVAAKDPLEVIYNSINNDSLKTSVFEDLSRRQIGIIDTGFSLSHPDINYKLQESSIDPIDGIDNDGNGIVDDAFGFYVDDDGNLFSNINERVFVKARGLMPFPFSHGAHVTSIALKDITSFSWNGFGGDMSNVKFLNQVNDRLQQSEIEFINMSFGFGDKRSPMAPNSNAFNALAKLITDNEQTLFFVAAGNEGSDIDGKYKQYPASFEYPNILTIGAVNTDQVNWDQPLKEEDLKLTTFSNSGIENVDIYAPGARVLGANVGQMTIPASGTSMASPYALNKVLAIAEAYPSLTPLQLKKIILLSSYIPNIDKPLPCVSGGILMEKRATLLAKLVTEQDSIESLSEMDYRDLAIEARRQLPLENEDLSENYLKQLLEIFKRI